MISIHRDRDGQHWVDGKEFAPDGVQEYRKTALARAVQMTEVFQVETLEGVMEGQAGDWLMIGVNGEMYPCAAEVFNKSYELA
jgi:hypothetical protein